MLITSNLFYQGSIGPATWIYTSEVLPPKGVGIVTTWNWGLTAIVAIVSPIVFESPIGPGGLFSIFAAFTFIAIFMV